MKVHIDFETRSKIDLIKCGAYKYSQDSSTDVLCLQYAIDDKPPVLWTPELDLPQELFDYIATGQRVVAHNAFFEQQIWHNICVKRYGFPKIPLEQWECSAAKAASYALPRKLDACGKALKLSKIKDESGRKVMLKLSKPKKPTKTDPSIWHDGLLDYDTLYNYCAQDVEAEREIDCKLADLVSNEQQVWLYDQRINNRGVKIDTLAVRNALEMIHEIYQDMVSEIWLLTDGKVDSLKKTAKIIDYLVETHKFKMPNLQKATVDAVLARKNLHYEVRRILELRRQGSLSSVSKYVALANSVCSDERIRDILMYHGASTGRWAGKLVQIQNLPRGSFKKKDDFFKAIEAIHSKDIPELAKYGNPLDVLSACIRGMFIASEGKDLVAADYNAIETRVLWWLADNDTGLNLFHNNICPYKDMGSHIYGVDISEIADDDDIRRQLGKTAVLGLGYGMGKAKFETTCLSQNIMISAELAEKAVTTYREVHAPVVALWKAYENAAKNAIRNPKQKFTTGKVTWYCKGIFLYALLPSGRKLAYAYPRLIEKYNKAFDQDVEVISFMGTSKGRWVEQDTYGGKLTENITQAIARDLLAEALIRCEDSSYSVVMHVHDEIVCEIPKEEKSLDEFAEILCNSSEWAKDIPIKAKGWRGERYRK